MAATACQFLCFSILLLPPSLDGANKKACAEPQARALLLLLQTPCLALHHRTVFVLLLFSQHKPKKENKASS